MNKKYIILFLTIFLLFSVFIPTKIFSTTCSLHWTTLPSPSFEVKDEDKDGYSDNTFVATVEVYNVIPDTDLIYAATLRITFDNTKLIAVDDNGDPITEGGALTPLAPYTWVFPGENKVYNSTGTIEYSAGATTGQGQPSEFIKINFKAKAIYGDTTASLNFTCDHCIVLINFEEEVTPTTCDVGSVSLKDKIPPSIPSGPSGPISIAPGNTQATLTWNNPPVPESDWAKTKVWMAGPYDAENPPPADATYTFQSPPVNKPTVTYTKTPLTNNKYYWFKITALDSSNNESFFSYNTGTVAVTNGSAIVTGTDTKFLNNVYSGLRFMVVGDSNSYLIQTVDSNTQITLTANYSGTTGTGKTYKIEQAGSVLVGEKKPNPPTNVTAVQPTPYNSNKKINITWTAPTQYTNGDSLTVLGYNLYRATSETGTYTKLNTSGLITTTSYTDPTPDDPDALSRGTTYWYRVTALDNASKESDKSSPGSIAYQDPVPATPEGLTATSGVLQTVNLSWNANAEVDLVGYNIYQASSTCVNCTGCTEPTSFTKITTVNAPTTTYQKTGLTNGTVYWYKITAFDNGSVPTPGSNESAKTAGVCIKVPEDVPPKVLQPDPIPQAPNATRVDVMFDEDLDTTSANTSTNYTIIKQGGGTLSVSSAFLQGDNKTVKLTTAPQEYQALYTCTVLNVKDKYNNPIVGPPNTLNFKGGMTDLQPPVVIDCDPVYIPCEGELPSRCTRSINNTTVAVEFYDCPMDGGIDPTTANTKTNYTITPTLSVSVAVLQANGKTVYLTTAQQLKQTYTVKVINVKDLNNNVIVNNNTTNVATFTGIPQESDPPVLNDNPVAASDGKSVMLTFTDTSGELESTSANNKNNYSIPGLTISAAARQANKLQVKLTTTQMASQTYTVTVIGVKDKWLNEIVAPGQSKDFSGPDTTPPTVSSANSPAPATVEVVFSEPVDLSTSQTATNYTFTPSLTVSSAVRQSAPNDNKVTLTVSDMKKCGNYTVRVRNVKDLNNNTISDNGTTNVATFTGTPPETTPPVPQLAPTPPNPPDSTHVNILFDEQLDQTSANTKTNYTIDGGLNVTSAVLQTDQKTVKLATSIQTNLQIYTITILGVKDKWCNEITGPPNTVNFTGTAVSDTTPPTVISATASNINCPGAGTVDVQFSEEVSSSTANVPSNYTITPSLTVSSAQLQADGITVRLTTSIQSNTSYQVEVINVQDVAPIPNTIVDNNTTNVANFTGIPCDSTPPSINSVTATGDTTVAIVFSESLDPGPANTSTNYTIDQGIISVSGASYNDSNKTVTLTTSTLTGGTNYNLTISNIKDLAGNTMNTTIRQFVGPDFVKPTVVSASAVNCTTVEVTFSEAVEQTSAETESNYSTDPVLTISSALRQTDTKKVRFNTPSQTAGQNYTLTVQNVTDLAGNTIDTTQNTAQFTGKSCDTQSPTVSSAKAVGNTYVDVKFYDQPSDGPIDSDTASVITNYTITGTPLGLDVLAAVVQTDQKTVRLETTEQVANQWYTVTVQNVEDAAGNVISGSNTALFQGGDIIPPKVSSTSAVDSTHVNVVFNEKVSTTPAQQIFNYSFDPQLDVTGAVLQTNYTTVQLTTSIQEADPENPTQGKTYTVTVNNVEDLSGNIIQPPDNTAIFVGIPGDTIPPQVVSATSPDSTHIHILFNEKMKATTTNILGNYTIDPYLDIRGAALQTDYKTVRLTTSSQTENQTYTVTVSNVEDESGNKIDPAYNSAQFTSDHTAPQLSSAIATGNTKVEVVFNEEVELNTSQNTNNYSTLPALTISGAEHQAGGKVLLTTSSQTVGQLYRLYVNNVTDINGNKIADNSNTTFYGVADIYYPQMESAVATSCTEVLVVFTKLVTKETAENKANYTIDYNISTTKYTLNIESAELQSDEKTVKITTASQLDSNYIYLITAVNISDKETPPNIIPAQGAIGNSKSFSIFGINCGQPPTITHTPVTVAVPETPITITASITDNGEVRSALVYYKKSTETNYTPVVMTQSGGNNYSGIIPGQVNETTIYYYIQATDDTNRTTRVPTSGYYSIQIRLAYGDLTGQVIRQDNSQPIEGVNITIANAANNYTTTTNSEGNYTINTILVGTYTLTAQKTGYLKVSQSVTIPDGVTTTANLQMGVVPPSPVKSIELTPDRVTLGPGKSTKFTCWATNEIGNKFEVTPEWELKVTPGSAQTELGTISSEGMFTAAQLNPGVEELAGKLIASYFVYTTTPPKTLKAEASITINKELLINKVTVTDTYGQEIKNRPFSPKTEIDGIKFWFDISQIVPTPVVELNIYDMKGNLIRTVMGDSTSGYALWNYKDEGGKIVPNGVYIYQLVIKGAKTVRSKPKLIGVFQ